MAHNVRMRLAEDPFLTWGWRYTICAALLMTGLGWGGFLGGPYLVLTASALAYAVPTVIALVARRNEEAGLSALLWYWRLGLTCSIFVIVLAFIRRAAH